MKVYMTLMTIILPLSGMLTFSFLYKGAEKEC